MLPRGEVGDIVTILLNELLKRRERSDWSDSVNNLTPEFLEIKHCLTSMPI